MTTAVVHADISLLSSISWIKQLGLAMANLSEQPDMSVLKTIYTSSAGPKDGSSALASRGRGPDG